MEVDGQDMRPEPLEQRRNRLSRLLSRKIKATREGIQLSEALAGDGAAMFRHACGLRLEGIVSKRIGSWYVSGRTRALLKTKNPNFERSWAERLQRVQTSTANISKTTIGLVILCVFLKAWEGANHAAVANNEKLVRRAMRGPSTFPAARYRVLRWPRDTIDLFLRSWQCDERSRKRAAEYRRPGPQGRNPVRVTSSQPKMRSSGCCRSGYLSSEFLDRVVHGFRGLDHGHMPCIRYDPRLRVLHQTRDGIHPWISHARSERYTLQIGVHRSGL